MNKMLLEQTCSLVVDISLLGFLWTKTISITNYLVNCNLTMANLGVIIEEKNLERFEIERIVNPQISSSKPYMIFN